MAFGQTYLIRRRHKLITYDELQVYDMIYSELVNASDVPDLCRVTAYLIYSYVEIMSKDYSFLSSGIIFRLMFCT